VYNDRGRCDYEFVKMGAGEYWFVKGSRKYVQ
jgi:hypothetical protein